MAITRAPFGITLSLDENAAETLGTLEKLSTNAVIAAQRRALNKTGRWLSTRMRRVLANYLGAKQKNINRRFRFTAATKGTAVDTEQRAYVWAGTNAFNPIKLGLKHGPLGTGYMAGEFYFDGGFHAQMKSGHKGVFSRKRKKRLPIQEEKIEVDHELEEAMDRLIAMAERQLLKVFKQELNFELLKIAGDV